MFAAVASTTMGCELLVSFDRSLIDAGVEDGGTPDAEVEDSAPVQTDGPADAPADTTLPPADGSSDAAEDTTVVTDANGVDTGAIDAGVDTGTGTGEDAGEDAGVDSGTDAGVDAAVDAGVDAEADTGVDSGVDAGADANDAGVDAGAPQITSFTVNESDAGCSDAGASVVTLSWTTTGATSASMVYDFMNDASAPLTSGALATTATGEAVSTIFASVVDVQCGDSVTLMATGPDGSASQTVTF
jgi:hypothetical protein